MRWYAEGLDELLTALTATDPAVAVWTWDPTDRTAGFWRRRMAHETAVHRVDAELAAGSTRGVQARLAVDGIDEALTLFMGDEPGSELGQRAGTLHLHATDAEGEWLATVHANALVVERGHAKADAALRGSASDLLLWLWGRGTLDRLERFGDPSIVARVRELGAKSMV
jgi:uncharacterized protein (TIGR03083 family)